MEQNYIKKPKLIDTTSIDSSSALIRNFSDNNLYSNSPKKQKNTIKIFHPDNNEFDDNMNLNPFLGTNLDLVMNQEDVLRRFGPDENDLFNLYPLNDRKNNKNNQKQKKKLLNSPKKLKHLNEKYYKKWHFNDILSEEPSLKLPSHIKYLHVSELLWLKRCLPIFAQPLIDIYNNYSLIKLFFEFSEDGYINDKNGNKKKNIICKMCIVYEGEASYHKSSPNNENSLATIFYRSYNRLMYKRTADINYIEYRGIDLDPSSEIPWQSIFTSDDSGEQSWSSGHRCECGGWFSLMLHYEKDIPVNEWEISTEEWQYRNNEILDDFNDEEEERINEDNDINNDNDNNENHNKSDIHIVNDELLNNIINDEEKNNININNKLNQNMNIHLSGFRPIIYVNTCNHLMGCEDINPSLRKHLWRHYLICPGNAHDAESFAKLHIPEKKNIIQCSKLLCCFPCLGLIGIKNLLFNNNNNQNNYNNNKKNDEIELNNNKNEINTKDINTIKPLNDINIIKQPVQHNNKNNNNNNNNKDNLNDFCLLMIPNENISNNLESFSSMAVSNIPIADISTHLQKDFHLYLPENSFDIV